MFSCDSQGVPVPLRSQDEEFCSDLELPVLPALILGRFGGGLASSLRFPAGRRELQTPQGEIPGEFGLGKPLGMWGGVAQHEVLVAQLVLLGPWRWWHLVAVPACPGLCQAFPCPSRGFFPGAGGATGSVCPG